MWLGKSGCHHVVQASAWCLLGRYSHHQMVGFQADHRSETLKWLKYIKWVNTNEKFNELVLTGMVGMQCRSDFAFEKKWLVQFFGILSIDYSCEITWYSRLVMCGWFEMFKIVGRSPGKMGLQKLLWCWVSSLLECSGWPGESKSLTLKGSWIYQMTCYAIHVKRNKNDFSILCSHWYRTYAVVALTSTVMIGAT